MLVFVHSAVLMFLGCNCSFILGLTHTHTHVHACMHRERERARERDAIEKMIGCYSVKWMVKM